MPPAADAAPSEHQLIHRERTDGTLVPACTCGWWSIDGSHWRFERHINAPEYTLECFRCGKRGTNVIFGYGYDRRCPDCGSYQIHPTKDWRREVKHESR